MGGNLPTHSVIVSVNDLVHIHPSEQTSCSGSRPLALLFLFPAGLKSAQFFIASFIRFLFLQLQETVSKSSKASNDGSVPRNML